jgi:hypothetical protein
MEILTFPRNSLYWPGILYPRVESSFQALTSLTEQLRAIED